MVGPARREVSHVVTAAGHRSRSFMNDAATGKRIAGDHKHVAPDPTRNRH